MNHYAEFCEKTKQATLNSLLATLKKSNSILSKANILKLSLINVTTNGEQSNGLLD